MVHSSRADALTHSPASEAAGGWGSAAPQLSSEESRELHQLLEEYKGVTSRLVASHDTLRTQLAGVQNELEEKNRELERKKRLEALGRVAAGVAHEFRNPLGGIRLTIDSLRRDLPAATSASEDKTAPKESESVPTAMTDRRSSPSGERLDRIERAVEHLDRIVDDLMTFTRDQALTRHLHPIGDLIEAAEEIAFSSLPSDRPELECVGDRETPCWVDRHAFTQVLVNLLDNARCVMAQDGSLLGEGPQIRLRWEIRALPSGARFRLEIADRGPGIPVGEEERIFHPFHTLRDEGTGLGLAIVHSRIEAHAGEISVESAPPGDRYPGARFLIELPMPNEVQ